MRVSPAEQNQTLQRDALNRAGRERLHKDTWSGSGTDRPGLAQALDQIDPGDALVGRKLDRTGRSRRVTLAAVPMLTTPARDPQSGAIEGGFRSNGNPPERQPHPALELVSRGRRWT